MSKDDSDTDGQNITECTKCHNWFTFSNYICHERQCQSTKHSRENPDVNTGTSSAVVEDNVFLPQDVCNDDSSVDSDSGLESGLFGDPYLDSLVMDRMHHLEPTTTEDSTMMPELEFDPSSNGGDIPEEDQMTPHNTAPPVHANGARFLTPLQEIEESDLNLTMEDHTIHHDQVDKFM
jgi:hypothetical protein